MGRGKRAGREGKAAPRTAPPLLRRLAWQTRRAAGAPLAGDYRSAFRGRGREFDQVVRYEFGDDVRDIDWNVTARRGEPYRKRFVEERELTVVLLLQDTPSLAFGSGVRTKREALLELAGLFALLAATNRDRAAFWYAAPGFERARRPARARSTILEHATELLDTPAPDPLGGAEAPIDWQRFEQAFPRHSVCVWLGDFPPLPPPAHWKALRRKFEMVGVRAEDAWERALPRAGVLSVLDPMTGEALPLDTNARATRRQHAAWVEARDRAFAELFPDPYARLTVRPEDDALAALAGFLRARTRGRAA